MVASTATVLEGTDALISSCTIGEEGLEFCYLFILYIVS